MTVKIGNFSPKLCVTHECLPKSSSLLAAHFLSPNIFFSNLLYFFAPEFQKKIKLIKLQFNLLYIHMHVYKIWKAKWKCNKFCYDGNRCETHSLLLSQILYICWCYCKMLLTKLKIPSHNFFLCSLIHFYLSIHTAVGLTLCRHRTVAMDKYKWRHVFVKYILEIYVNYHCTGILNVCKRHWKKNRWKPQSTSHFFFVWKITWNYFKHKLLLLLEHILLVSFFISCFFLPLTNKIPQMSSHWHESGIFFHLVPQFL